MRPDLILIDGHSDILMDVLERRLEGAMGTLASDHLPRLQRGGIDAVFCPVAVDSPGRVPNDTASARKHIAQIEEEVAATRGEAVLARSSDEIRRAAAKGQVAIVLGLEGAKPLGTDPENVRRFHELGILWVTLTWNGPNQVGDGVGVEEGRGLTAVGRDHVAAMNDVGVIVDVTHAHPRTLGDAVTSSTAPVIASHSNARALCNHVRNLEDDQIQAVAASGGTLGVNFFPALVGPDPTVEDVARHMAYIERLVGMNAVAIGADYIDFAEATMGAALAASTVDYGRRLAYPDGVANTTELANVLPALDATATARPRSARWPGRTSSAFWRWCMRSHREREGRHMNDRGTTPIGALHGDAIVMDMTCPL